ncbi:imidazole glycerol phosphate synthase subunit HisH [Sphingomonas sp.]|uniref:imidazole glycerol phosphate synthase subunit HisH n=1 Tax=Sphingomonas sp. TaxID=28214 RepID=UPI00286AB247|nr:imidazole glycerol phosphate synthase subunit HisH [Sphingomonas sp.]
MSDLLILDLDYGNTRSIALAFERLGASVALSADPAAVDRADRVVLPGVGAAGTAMKQLRQAGLDDALRRRTGPTLGICLGMQLMFENSDEDGGTKLLGILPGSVAELRPSSGFPVPHMGWSALTTEADNIGLDPGDYVYFAHSFACPDSSHVAARAAYGGTSIPAVVRSGAWWGAQFHPERSSAAGSRFLSAFLAA